MPEPGPHPAPTPDLRFAAITDLHCGERPPTSRLAFTDSLAKLRHAIDAADAADLPLLLVLGDLIDDEFRPEVEAGLLDRVDAEFARFHGRVLVAPGNHDLINFDKAGFAARLPHALVNGPRSVELHGVRVLLLDTAFRDDGRPYAFCEYHWQDAWVGQEQLPWLVDQLHAAGRAGQRVVIAAHHMLCHPRNLQYPGRFTVHNDEPVRRIIADAADTVALVLTGHYHWADSQTIDGARYETLPAAVWPEAPLDHAFVHVHVTADDLALTGHTPARHHQRS